MPRRRPARNEASKRPAPALPEGDEGKDMDHEKRREKVQTLIRDFKTEVDSRIRSLKAGVTELLNQIDLAYTMEMMFIPAKIRKMPLKEFLENGGSFETSEVGKSIDDKLTSILEGDSRSSRKNLPLESINESNSNETKATRPSRRRRKADVAAEGPPPTTRRGRALATPVSKTFLSAATPLITPKFDPRLYQTPAVQRRVPKPGEVIISMEGSPLMNPFPGRPNPDALIVPLKDNKIFVLDGNMDVDQIDISQVDPNFVSAALRNLNVMDAKLKAIMNHSSVASK